MSPSHPNRGADKRSDVFLVPVQITKEAVANLLCAAFESSSGSHYWIKDWKAHVGEVLENPMGEQASGMTTPVYVEAPFSGKLEIMEDDQDETRHTITRTSLRIALGRLAAQHAEIFGRVMKDETDATDGDVFLQLCIFEEAKYG